jgi:DNA processing protein
LGVAVLESPQKSGALITAARALEQGRDVFSMPGNIDAGSCAGSNALLREGAIPILSAEDIISEYADLFPNKITRRETARNMEESGSAQNNNDDNYFKAQQRITGYNKPTEENVIDNMPIVEYIDVEKILKNLSGNEKIIAKIIGTETVHVDDMIVKSNFSASEVLTALTMLELSGTAQKVAGSCFKLVDS